MPRSVAALLVSDDQQNQMEQWLAAMVVAAINDFLAAWNENPKPFIWTATVDSIVSKLARCRQTLEQILPGCTSPKHRKRLSS